MGNGTISQIIETDSGNYLLRDGRKLQVVDPDGKSREYSSLLNAGAAIVAMLDRDRKILEMSEAILKRF